MIVLFILSASVGVVFSSAGFYPLDPGKNYCDYNGHKIKQGEIYHPPGECIEIQCNGDVQDCPTTVVEMTAEEYKHFLKPDPHEVLMKMTYPKCCDAFIQYVLKEKKKHH